MLLFSTVSVLHFVMLELAEQSTLAKLAVLFVVLFLDIVWESEGVYSFGDIHLPKKYSTLKHEINGWLSTVLETTRVR